MAAQTKLGLDDPYVNTGLFADNFLENRLGNLPEFKQARQADLIQLLEEITVTYNKYAKDFTDATNEAVTEDDFVKPVLNILWNEADGSKCYQVQQTISIPGTSSKRKPDYAFFCIR